MASAPTGQGVGQPYEDVILEEARRAIQIQSSSLDELRSRTGVLLAAAALSASFLGSATAHGGVAISFWGGAALILFAIGVALCVYVLAPQRKSWTFVNSSKVLAADWIETEQPDESMRLFLAGCMEDQYDQNQKQMEGLYHSFTWAAVAIGTSVVLGCVQLASSH
jgi:hypothetical protein